MNKPQEIANYIILEAYKNDGEIDFEELNIEADWQLMSQVNDILKVYGNLMAELTDETWASYSLTAHGNDFASQGAFQGLEQERKIDRTAKRFSILAVVIAFASLIVSIIASCK